MIISVFDAATGAVDRVATISGDLYDPPVSQLREGEGWIEGSIDGSVSRLDPVTLEVLPLMAFACSVATNTLSGVPAGSFAHVRGVKVGPIEDGVLELAPALGLPEDVQVMLLNPIYHPQEFIVPCA